MHYEDLSLADYQSDRCYFSNFSMAQNTFPMAVLQYYLKTFLVFDGVEHCLLTDKASTGFSFPTSLDFFKLLIKFMVPK